MRHMKYSAEILITFVFMIMIVFSFAPTLHDRFVDWDDFDNFVKNPWFTNAGWHSFREVWHSVVIGVYQPLAWTAMLLQRLLFGLEARVLHSVSVLLHLLNTLLVYRLTLILLRHASWGRPDFYPTSKAMIAVATLITMLHPLKVEVVAWASCQPYLWAAFWALACLCCYANLPGDTNKSFTGRQVWAFVFFVFSLLSKTWAIGIPLILLLLDYYPLKNYRSKSIKQLLIEKIPYLVVSVLTVVVGIWARSKAHDMHSFSDRSILERLARVGIALCDYALHIVWPINLAAFYPEPKSPELFSLEAISGFIVFGGVLFLAWKYRQRLPALLVATASFVILVFPNLGFVPTGRVTGADRYTYLATISFAPILAYSLNVIAQHGRRASLAAGILSLLMMSGLIQLTRRQSTYWSDSITLWQRSLDVASNKTAELYFNVARSMQLAGQLDDAIRLYHQSLSVDAKFLKSLQNLGAVHLGRREYASALPFIQRLLELKPDEAGALSNLGLTLSALGRMDEAHNSFVKAVSLDPTKPDFTLNLALFFIRINRTDKALQIIDWYKSQGLTDQRLDLVYTRVLLRLQRFPEAQNLLTQVVPLWRKQDQKASELECLLATLQAADSATYLEQITDETCRTGVVK